MASIPNEPIKVIIIGAGTVGPLLALALKRAPQSRETFAPVVFDSVGDWKDVGGGFVLQPSGLNVFERLGLLDDVYKAGMRLDHLKVTDEKGNPIIDIDTKSAFEDRYGKPQVGMKRHNLIEAIMEHVRAEGIPVHFGKRLTNVTQSDDGSVTATFEDGHVETGHVLVGCDGVRSAVKAAVFGESPELRWTGIEMVMGLTHAEIPDVPRNLNRGMIGKGHSALVYGLSETESIWTIAYRPEKMEPSRWGQQSDRQAVEELTELLRKGEFDEWMVKLVPTAHRVIRIGIRDRDPIDTWTKGLVALAGDAAHPMMPDLGLGANCGLEDVGVLAELLTRAVESPEDLPQSAMSERLAGALKAYEKMRSERAKMMVEANRGVEVINYLENGFLCALRNVFIRALFAIVKTTPSTAKFHKYDYKTAVEEFLVEQKKVEPKGWFESLFGNKGSAVQAH
ncbi:hypothetical protein BJ742DRAFT_821037 [Cladochytrium replicatum]|nr:hypothetical protein BJ742DRAFT_821037 [Cladochytrium replicatum]